MEVRERSRLVPLLVYAGGLVLMFLGERVFSTINAARMTLSLGGFGLAVAYLVLRLKGLGSETGDRKAIEKMLEVDCVRFVKLWEKGIEVRVKTTKGGHDTFKLICL